jgi:predicted phosphodiesterase
MNKPFEPGENIIWKDDFESGEMKDWKVINEVTDEKPNWFIEKGYLIQDTDCGKTKELLGTNIINGSPEWHNYILRTNMVCADDDYIGVLFRFKDIDNYYRFLLSSQRRLICLEKKVNGEFIRLASFTDEEWQYVRFSVTIVLNESNIKVYLNDEPFFDVNDDQFSKGKIGFTSISNLGSFFDDVTVYSDYKIIPPVTKLKISRGPYLQNVLEDNAVIMWDTSIPVNSEVEYGLTKEETESIVDSLKTTKHEIKLDRLKQETVYYYRIKTGKLTGEWHSFKTAVKENTPFTFLAYGDTQLNFLRHNELTEQFIKHDFDFLINCGDVVQRGPRSDWDVEFFEPLKNILTNKPIYAAIGNHELNSENFYKNFANPNEEHENYYSFQYGNSFFIFIDNPRAGYPDREYYTDYRPGSDQYKWLEEQLASEKAQKAEWLFVVSHIPSYVAGSQEHYSGCKKHLVPLFEKYGVDVSFSGHVHGYERGEVNGVTYIITAGGGGAQNKPDPEKIKSYKDFKLVYNFCIIDINENTLSFKAFDKNNRGIDEFTVKH